MTSLVPQQNKAQNNTVNPDKVWNSARVAEITRKMKEGIDVGHHPFLEGDFNVRCADIIYEYNDEEMSEISKCAADPVYFANNYCVTMTDSGVKVLKDVGGLRDYQEDVLTAFNKHRFNVFLASRQIGKTVTSSIFIAWFVLFNVDKNVMILANKGATAAEIMDKIKTVLKGLPFFLKPGISQNNVMGMRFDNGCRIMSQATTKTAAIGFAIHLCYMDEFAHIQESYLEPFYRSVYPTISSSKISKIIITSTPHGHNKFYHIYKAAMEKKNGYNPIRVDWWQVPGRDEAWKKQEIANLGSEELFNQEYGNQFLAGDARLLPGATLKAMEKKCVPFIHKQIDEMDDAELDYSELKWHPDFSFYDIDIKRDKFVWSIDIADGAGKDYSVINLFKIEVASKAAIRKTKKDRIENETPFFRLIQVGCFRSNKAAVEEVAKITDVLLFKVFNPDNVRIAVEMNFKGDFFVEKLSKNDNFYEEIMLHTKHSERAKQLQIGIRIYKHNKLHYCRELRKLIMEKRIIVLDRDTFDELDAFCVNSRGTYSSQTGHDDIAMTCVNVVPFIYSNSFQEIVEDLFARLPQDMRDIMMKRIEEADAASGEAEDFSYLKDLL